MPLGETPALHPARETRAHPFHGFWVVAAATMDDCYKKGLASMGPRKRIISATSALKMPPCTAGACPGLPWVPPQACSAGVPLARFGLARFGPAGPCSAGVPPAGPNGLRSPYGTGEPEFGRDAGATSGARDARSPFSWFLGGRRGDYGRLL